MCKDDHGRSQLSQTGNILMYLNKELLNQTAVFPWAAMQPLKKNKAKLCVLTGTLVLVTT